ncbi:type 1 glutamine amidotransferase [Catalinimonas alkaloidigena]|uniref:ThuA domain-containing protein n=1 Tax=Catalinimonas alkaloidigena TaxID=1075417 RepID=UPI002406F074|nr:ThuA domain-containing protein [Catalinimonas alkaloidigena]MDF9799916.1 type 1 glutamine amidotransferase [Catalinimonas alkaloidigena]
MKTINQVKKLIYPLLKAFCFGSLSLILSTQIVHAQEGEKWVTYEPENGPGNGKYIVLVSGDEEYRSEEALPMLAKILAKHHGFKTTVLFAIDPENGEIDPEYNTNIPGLEHLETADLMVLFTRWRHLPAEQMKYIDAYTKAGKPVVAMRTSTHAFKYDSDEQSPYARYSSDSKVEGWREGYGRQVLGETWVAHHGKHGKEGTRGLINGLHAAHPILKSVQDIWGPTDVYTIRDLTEDAEVLLWGQTTKGMSADAPLSYEKSVMPVAWTKSYQSESGKTARVFTTTMGASIDLQSEDLRRMMVNACFWTMEMEDQIPEEANVEYVGEYEPTMFGFGDHQKGLKPSDFVLK